PPPNMLPMEHPARRVARPAEATTRNKVCLVMSVLPARLRIGSFKRHEDGRSAAGGDPRAVLDKDFGHNTVAQDQRRARIACAHSKLAEIPVKAKAPGQFGITISQELDLVERAGSFGPGLHDVVIIDRGADDLA